MIMFQHHGLTVGQVYENYIELLISYLKIFFYQ